MLLAKWRSLRGIAIFQRKQMTRQARLQDSGQGAETRRWARHKIDTRLKAITRLSDGSLNSVFGRGHTLSPGGLGAYIPTSIPVGTKVELELTFSYSSNELKIRAVVRSCEGFHYNLEFVEMAEDARQSNMKSYQH